MTDQRSLRWGEQAIANAQLEAVPNQNSDRDYKISVTLPEFTCLCPRSGYPDFATIKITYVPDQHLAELRALKLYINKFRDEHVFHEAVVNQILDDLVACVRPRWMRVVGDFNARGNVKTVVTAVYQSPDYAGPPAHLPLKHEE